MTNGLTESADIGTRKTTNAGPGMATMAANIGRDLRDGHGAADKPDSLAPLPVPAMRLGVSEACVFGTRAELERYACRGVAL